MAREFRQFPCNFDVALANIGKFKAEAGGGALLGALDVLKLAKTELSDADRFWLQGANGMTPHPHKRNTVVVYKETRQ